MCCLKNEQETYEYLRQRVKVLIEQNDTKEEREYQVADLKFKAKRKNVKVTKEELKELAKLEDNK